MFLTLTSTSIFISTVLAIVAGSGLIMFDYLRKKGNRTSAKFLAYFEIGVAIWALTGSVEFLFSDLQAKIWTSKFSYFGVASTPVTFFLFAFTYIKDEKLFSKNILGLLFLIPITTILLVFTNEYHHLIWNKVFLDPDSGFIRYEHGPWFVVFRIYAYLMLAWGTVILAFDAIKRPKIFVFQRVIIFIAILFPVAGNIIYLSESNPVPGLDWTIIAFLGSGITLALGTEYYGLFDVLPYAKNKLFDIISDGILILDEKNVIIDYNKSFSNIWNIDKKKFVGKSVISLFSNHKKIIDLINFHIPSLSEICILSGSGSKKEVYYDILLNKLEDNSQLVYGKILLFHNITSRRNIEVSLQNEIYNKANLIKDLDAFAHTVSHDTKNLIGSIISSSALLNYYLDEKDFEGAIRVNGFIKKAADKSLNINKELLILAGVRNAEVTFHQISMAEIIREAIDRLSGISGFEAAEFSLAKEWPTVVGHAPWIEEVWLNYFSNAIKYGGNPAKIYAGWQQDEKDPDSILFFVRDNGNGVSKANQNKLFQEFSRVHAEKIDGIGLGLSIVKRIIDKHNGIVSVESTNKIGEGATFYFTLKKI